MGWHKKNNLYRYNGWNTTEIFCNYEKCKLTKTNHYLLGIGVKLKILNVVLIQRNLIWSFIILHQVSLRQLSHLNVKMQILFNRKGKSQCKAKYNGRRIYQYSKQRRLEINPTHNRHLRPLPLLKVRHWVFSTSLQCPVNISRNYKISS